MKSCKQCGSEFHGRANAVYCSSTCRQKSYRRGNTMFHIGDTVSIPTLPLWDGTVVDVIDPTSKPPLVRVYWRYPLGKVSDHRTPELRRR